MSSDKPLVHFVAPQELIDEIDEFRFKHRFQSRAAAIKWLLRWGLQQQPAPTEEEMRSE